VLSEIGPRIGLGRLLRGVEILVRRPVAIHRDFSLVILAAARPLYATVACTVCGSKAVYVNCLLAVPRARPTLLPLTHNIGHITWRGWCGLRLGRASQIRSPIFLLGDLCKAKHGSGGTSRRGVVVTPCSWASFFGKARGGCPFDGIVPDCSMGA